MLGDGKSEFAFVKGSVAEKKGRLKRMFGKKWKPGEGLEAAQYDGSLAPLRLLASGARAGSGALEFRIEIEWKKDKTGVVKIPLRLSGDDAAPLMDLLRNGLPAPPAEFQAR